MGKCYRKSFLKKVIARIDFTSQIEVSIKGFKKESSERILKSFPILEPREVIAKQVELSDRGTKETSNKQNHLVYHGNEREKVLYVSPEYAYVEINRYNSFNDLKKDFHLLIKALSESADYSIKRFGLRYINQIDIDITDPLNWDKYINSNLIDANKFIDQKEIVSRIFSSIIQRYDDNMQLTFQYGLHNPDFPARIKKPLYILDYDAFIQGVMQNDFVIEEFDKAHERIEALFEKSITQDLRDKMVVINE